MKPARPPAATPQISTPRAFAASRSLPARAWPDGRATARPSAIARSSLCIADLPLSFILAPLLHHPCSTVVEACARDYLLAEQSLMQDHCRLMLFRTAGGRIDLKLDSPGWWGRTMAVLLPRGARGGLLLRTAGRRNSRRAPSARRATTQDS